MYERVSEKVYIPPARSVSRGGVGCTDVDVSQ